MPNNFLTTYSNYWSLAESIIAIFTFGFSLTLFFIDPIRRWRFFGFRPTALVILYDRGLKKVLLIRNQHGWEFNQGGIYEDNILNTVEHILFRELSLENNQYKLYFVKALGKMWIKDSHEKLQRSTIGGITIARTLQGKGYIGCFVSCDLQKIFSKIKLSHELHGKKIVSLKEAQRIIFAWQKVQKPQKLVIITKALGILEELINIK